MNAKTDKAWARRNARWIFRRWHIGTRVNEYPAIVEDYAEFIQAAREIGRGEGRRLSSRERRK